MWGFYESWAPFHARYISPLVAMHVAQWPHIILHQALLPSASTISCSPLEHRQPKKWPQQTKEGRTHSISQAKQIWENVLTLFHDLLASSLATSKARFGLSKQCWLQKFFSECSIQNLNITSQKNNNNNTWILRYRRIWFAIIIIMFMKMNISI